MQTNTPYVVPLDNSSRNTNAKCQPISQDNIIVSSIFQSYVSCTANGVSCQPRSPINVGVTIGDNIYYQRSQIMSSQNQPMSQRFNPPVISTARPIPVRQQPSYSTVIPTTKVVDKSKKKMKSRFKSKYLIKLINIKENVNPDETILTFEIMLLMNQMRFTCALRNEINTLDVSNSVGDAGQITGELHKKDVLESLVNTVKKMCLCLISDISSIPLYEDYVFHPCPPNSGLLKLSDCVVHIPGSLDSDNNNLNATMSVNPIMNCGNSFNPSTNPFQLPGNDDVTWSVDNLSMAISNQLCHNMMESETFLFGDNDLSKSTLSSLENPKTSTKGVCEKEACFHCITTSKCSCPTNESTLKVPEYLFILLKQIIEKLLNIHCKGVIILPQSNEILTRNFRILEIPADHMFVGLPCSDSSYNVIKGHKDKDFIIAKDTRYPEPSSVKCVYQKPPDGAVLLDSSGDIQYIRKPCLIIPSQADLGYTKTEIKTLPPELTHNKDQPLDCDQIISVLQSLLQIKSSSALQSTFDSPVLLEPKSIIGSCEIPEMVDTQTRRGSDGSTSAKVTPQSQIQVERLFCQYVALTKASDQRQEEVIPNPDNYERDLPKQQIRSRKISNESLDSITGNRSRATSTVSYGKESDIIQSQSGFSKVMPNNPQGILQNTPKPVPVGTILNQVPVHILPNIPSSVPTQYVITNQNPNNSSGNIFLQGVSSYPLFSKCSQGPGPTMIMSQSNQCKPMVLSNQTSMGYNFAGMYPNQVILPSCSISQSQMSQFHQMQHNANQRMTTPSSISSASLSSSQLLNNIQFLQHTIPVPSSQQAPYSSQMSGFPSDKLTVMQPAHVADMQDPALLSLTRQIQLTNVRQLAPGSSQYSDQNLINSLKAESLRTQMKSQPCPAQVQQQTTPVLLIPHQTVASSNCCTQSNPLPQTSITPSKKYPQPSEPTSIANYNNNNNPQPNILMPEYLDNKQKVEQQTIGRFVIRPVVSDTTQNS